MISISNLKNSFLLSVFCIFLCACENHVEEITDNTNEEQEVCNPDISFSNVIKPIIDQNCTDCHGGSRSPDLRTYSNISRNANRIKAEVTSRRMPQGGSLTNEEIEQIRCWIESGALDN